MVSAEAGAVAANQSVGNKNVKNIRERPVLSPSVLLRAKHLGCAIRLKISLGHGFSKTMVYQSILIMLDYVLSNNRESTPSSKARPFSQVVPYRKTNEG
jgi:hypothetical protein